ncbi:uncharacterized protein LOC132304448 [Cornus florida]|uniref:uncharacterized protein LOC132304448 n=1 Tax=Cornus florida TaxID=4283 RepID=UPI0028A2CEAD|nr:uncharacterized protein LOC132304448 [Cornus florida]
MSSGEVRKVSCQDIQLVQNLIEHCIQLYMRRKEVVNTLLVQAKVEPVFTELVWQKLEEENQEFFKAYYLRLILKEQVIEFNKLLASQDEMTRHMRPNLVAPTRMVNGSHILPTPHNSAIYPPEQTGPAVKPEDMCQPVGTSFPNAFLNHGPSVYSRMQTAFDMPAHAREINVSPNMLFAQNSNVGIQGMNGGMITSELGYAGNSTLMFGADRNVLETHPAIEGATMSSFRRVESNSQPWNEAVLDADMSSSRLLGQIPQNFRLTDLTADFSSSSDFGTDILKSYNGSPFLATDTDFLQPHGWGEQQGEAFGPPFRATDTDFLQPRGRREQQGPT